MGNIFSGLESLGIKNVKDLDVFQNSDEQKKEKELVEKKQVKELVEEDYIFDKTYTCPVCDKEFKSKTIRTGKVRLEGADSDLRPRYNGVDSLKYDAVMCPRCGYAALNRYFTFIMASQAKAIKEKISKTFKVKQEKLQVYSYDVAIEKHKMALLNTVVKNGKNSERAYTCLKLAWLYRGKREELMAEPEYDKAAVKELVENEKELLENAFDGFEAAYSKEDFPMCGMDSPTMVYLLAELARRIGKTDDAKKYVAKVLVGRDANRRIKDKALELKEKLQAGENEE